MRQRGFILIIICLLLSVLSFCPSSNSIHGKAACSPPGMPESSKNRFVPEKGQAGPLHWTHKIVTYSFSLNTPYFAKFAFHNAFNQWAVAVDCKIKFQEVAFNPDIYILWDDSGSKTANIYWVGYVEWNADYPNSTFQNAEIIMNAKSYAFHAGAPWGPNLKTTNVDGQWQCDIEGPALHEVGHAIGMDHWDISPTTVTGPIDQQPTMSGIVQAGAELLHQDDIAGAKAIYGDKDIYEDEYNGMLAAFSRAGVPYDTQTTKKLPSKLAVTPAKQITVGTTVYNFDDHNRFQGFLLKNKYYARKD